MERIDGVVPRADLPADALTPEQARGMCLNMIDVLVELHSVDAEAAGLGSLGKGLRLRPPAGRGLVARAAATRAPTTRRTSSA